MIINYFSANISIILSNSVSILKFFVPVFLFDTVNIPLYPLDFISTDLSFSEMSLSVSFSFLDAFHQIQE